MSEIESKNGFSILNSFNQIGQLLSSQKESIEKFDTNTTYGKSVTLDHTHHILPFYANAFESMDVGTHKYLKGWELDLAFNDHGVVDPAVLYQNLRLLPDGDVRKIRLFNRFVGQQMFNTSTEDIFEYQTQKIGVYANPFWDTFCSQAKEYALLNGSDLPIIKWPQNYEDLETKRELRSELKSWREKFIVLPGISTAIELIKDEEKEVFNAFFHIQRQFDADNWKDVDSEGKPNPQPLPRIAGYRQAIKNAHAEFHEAEGSISMCFDYCKMSPQKVVMYIRSAEDAFLRIVNRLDDEYPLGIDFSHTELHNHSKMIKHMMFPLRCVFFTELEDERSSQDSTDNTLDSYLDMTLGNSKVSVPPDYFHEFKIVELDEDLQKPIKNILKGKSDSEVLNTNQLVEAIHHFSTKENRAFSNELSALCDVYEQKYKSDENNLTRRLGRLSYLYTTAMAQKEMMGKASQERLDSIGKMASHYAEKAASFSTIDIEDDNVVRNLTPDKLPMMASPQQLEDLYNTHKVVGRLADSNGEFKDTASQIEEGLKAAMEMMKKAEELMIKIVTHVFPKKEDSKDLLHAIHELISLSYSTQQLLADLEKKEAIFKKTKSKKAEKDFEKIKQEMNDSKTKTKEIQDHLKKILKSKNDLVAAMRITQKEKDHNFKQLKMITLMTITSMQSQGV